MSYRVTIRQHDGTWLPAFRVGETVTTYPTKAEAQWWRNFVRNYRRVYRVRVPVRIEEVSP